MPSRSDVGVIIVNFRTPDLTLKCVESILRWDIARAEDVVVVENFSQDDSLTRLRESLPARVRLLEMTHNGGFGAGVNAGGKSLDSSVLLVLNPDTYFIDSSIISALQLLRNSDVGLVGLDLIYPTGERQYSARRFYSLFDIVLRRSPLGRMPWLRGYVDSHMMRESWMDGLPFDAEWVMGTGFLIRKDVFDEVGGMDESYFLYMEDVDLCAKVWSKGYKVRCVPNAVLVHDHQRSSAAGPFSWAGKLHLRSLNIFRRKFCVPLFFRPGVKGILRSE
jgi:N-acetylglucosaminyl-diphospho-decaprenol L-rhamnosyltransferase